MNVDIIRNGKREKGNLIVLQLLGEMADGKLHFVAGEDDMNFNLEDGDRFYTAVFTVDPFEDVRSAAGDE